MSRLQARPNVLFGEGSRRPPAVCNWELGRDERNIHHYSLPRISTQKSVKARTFAGGCLREGWKANSGNCSPCHRGKRSISAPLASNSLTPQPIIWAIPVPATHSSNMHLGSATDIGPLDG